MNQNECHRHAMGRGRSLAQEIARLRKDDVKSDYLLHLLRHLSKPAGYAAVATFRRCLVCCTDLGAETARRYTLHSLKVTSPCWASQLGIDAAQARRGTIAPAPSPNRSRHADVTMCCHRWHGRRFFLAISKGWVPLALSPDRNPIVPMRDCKCPPLKRTAMTT